MAVEMMPISGTVMFETMFGSAMRSISRFMFIRGCKDKVKVPNLRALSDFISKSGMQCAVIRKNGLPLPHENRVPGFAAVSCRMRCVVRSGIPRSPENKTYIKR